jgi:hypothetical protein
MRFSSAQGGNGFSTVDRQSLGTSILRLWLDWICRPVCWFLQLVTSPVGNKESTSDAVHLCPSWCSSTAHRGDSTIPVSTARWWIAVVTAFLLSFFCVLLVWRVFRSKTHLACCCSTFKRVGAICSQKNQTHFGGNNPPSHRATVGEINPPSCDGTVGEKEETILSWAHRGDNPQVRRRSVLSWSSRGEKLASSNQDLQQRRRTSASEKPPAASTSVVQDSPPDIQKPDRRGRVLNEFVLGTQSFHSISSSPVDSHSKELTEHKHPHTNNTLNSRETKENLYIDTLLNRHRENDSRGIRDNYYTDNEDNSRSLLNGSNKYSFLVRNSSQIL